MATELVQQLLSLHDPSYVPIVSNGGIKTALNKLLSYTNHTHQQTTITSWKMSDFAYKKEPCPFPTRARGLFTTKLQNNHHKIVARGYDKFFNIDEVSWTKVHHLSPALHSACTNTIYAVGQSRETHGCALRTHS